MGTTYVSLDLETTGLDPRTDSIIEIGAIKFEGDVPIEEFHTLVRPPGPVPYRVQILTGIIPQDVEGAPPVGAVLGDLVSFVGECPVVGHSVAFDIAFLAAQGVDVVNPTYDTFELATVLLPSLADYSLSAVADELGVPYTVRHRALADAAIAKDVFLGLLGKARELDLSIVAEIDRLTRGVDWPPAQLFRRIAEERMGGALRQQDVAAPAGVEDEREERLTRHRRKKAVDLESLTAMLAPGGVMEKAFPAFEHRPEQVQMMAAVAHALNEGEHLIVEAGTGTGKSVAYLMPAALFAVENKTPVVISTNTINLQEQLMNKDIPDVIKVFELQSLPVPRYAQLKGRNNYLCQRRWASLRRSQPLPLDEVKLLVRTLVWAALTETGDRAELNLRGQDVYVWNRICAQSESCLGAQCPYQSRGACHLYRARRKAESAHLVVVNHALLLSDIASVARGRIVPDHAHLIVDEAHHLEGEATEQWGFEVGVRQLETYLNHLSETVAEGRYAGFLFELAGHFRGSSVSGEAQRDVGDLIEAMKGDVGVCRERVVAFFDTVGRFVEALAEEQGPYERRLRFTKGVRSQPGWGDVEIQCENLCLALTQVDSGLNRLYTMLEPFSDADILDYDDLMTELSFLSHRCGELGQQVNAVVALQGEGMVYWAATRERGNGFTLCAAPLHVGRILEHSLFSEKESVVLTSATLSTEGHFEYIKERLGLSDAGELLLGSSFDYAKAAMVIVPEDIPEPGQMGYQKAVQQVLVDLCRAAEGRTLALFTSHAAVRASYEAIRASLAVDGILALAQGVDGSTKSLLDTFKANPRTVLLGTSSFWEGIDVVGEGLSVLAMARLPFNVPSDPVFAARAELFEDAFNEYAVPQAILRFKQGFGRLIRSRSDRGVMVVLDRRIKAKSYGAAFLESLPPCTVKSGPMRHLPREVVAWLGRK